MLERQDIGLINKLKDVELTFMRGYTTVMMKDMNELNGYIKDKVGTIEDFVKKTLNNARAMNTLVEVSFETMSGDSKHKVEFIKNFKPLYREILDSANKVLNK